METSLKTSLFISLLFHLALVLLFISGSFFSIHRLSGYASSSGPLAFMQVFIPGEPGKLLGGKNVARKSVPQEKVVPLGVKENPSLSEVGQSQVTESALQTLAGEGGGSPGGGLGGGGGVEVDLRFRRIREQIEQAKTYPQLALRQGQAGIVRLRFRISENGEPLDASVEQTSGFDLLDGAALHTVKRAGPYPVVSGWLTFPLRYDLEVARGP